MDILVTGSSRGAGRVLAEDLAARGHRVHALLRSPGDVERLQPAWNALGIHAVLGDVTDRASLETAMAGCQAVVHAAAAVGEEKDDPQLFYDVNVAGTANTWRAAHAAGVKHAVLISSVAVYGRPDVPEVDESAPIRPNDVAYERTKAAAEDVALSLGRMFGVRTVLLRPSLVWGPHDRQFVPRILRALRGGGFAYVGDPDRAINLCCSQHLAACAHASLLRENINQAAFNVVDGELPSWRDAVGLIARVAGLPPPSRSIPRRAALALGGALDGIRSMGLEVPLPFTRFTAHVAGARCVYRVDRARAQLGYEPVRVFLRDGEPFIREAMTQSG